MRFRTRYRRHPAGIVLAVLALCLRLAAPAWAPLPAASPAGADFAALLGEHALCLGGSRGEAPPADDPKPAHEHDTDTCCLFHAAAGGGGLPSAPSTAIVRVATRIVHFLPAATAPPIAPSTTARARAPPSTA